MYSRLPFQERGSVKVKIHVLGFRKQRVDIVHTNMAAHQGGGCDVLDKISKPAVSGVLPAPCRIRGPGPSSESVAALTYDFEDNTPDPAELHLENWLKITVARFVKCMYKL
jgi:hypothetical protein